ncbi:uncharacterized protein A1O9_12661 [Exophiala aquamarina CBS 119918]|uniref:NmrA-like domain-containing protein n=1 Tax=Exophiala aquamarina CBS 119918 TaxID=1182545 RepID=A0A072NUP2_9EURO|nr:uncharacterized protein A1O9_12661 [Exophiala aquamarina CBS 119918]KEF51311.1 hypothetical protein A1O9_12661 [Exophiala aquamarina CBS 119918]
MAEVTIKHVLVIGGGGNLGPEILHALQEDSTFTVSVLTRESSSSTSTYSADIRLFKVDDSYPATQLHDAFKGQDAIICALSLQSIDQQFKFIDCAVEAGVKVFVPAEFGGNKGAAKHGEKMPLHDTKDLVLEHLRKVEEHGLSWTAIATGPFIDWGLANGFLGFDITSQQAKIYGTGNEAWTGTTVKNIGVAVARLLHKPQDVKNRFIYIYSVRTSQNEILATMEAVTGSKWHVQHLEWDEEIPAGRRLLDSGNRAGVVPLILSYFFRNGMGADYVNDVEADNALLDLPTQHLEEIVREAVL